MNTDELTKKANDLYFKNNFYEALALYLKILSEDLSKSANYYNVALVYDALKDYELAMANYKKAITLDNNNIRAVNNLAIIYIEIIKDFNIAKKYLDHAIKISPNDAEAYNLYGNISLIENDIDLAIRYFKKSILLDKDYFKNYYDIALAYFAKDDNDNARKNVETSLKLCPDFEKAKELLQEIL